MAITLSRAAREGSAQIAASTRLGLAHEKLGPCAACPTSDQQEINVKRYNQALFQKEALKEFISDCQQPR
jgi:hypothetical protein